MSKWLVDIHGNIEGDYEIVKKYEEKDLKTGQWLHDGTLTCSNCGCIVYPIEIENGNYNYCPNCGSHNEE